MDQSKGTIGQKIAQAARAFEKRRTKHGRKWVAVFMNEDTIVIALHGSLTAAEKALAQSPAGAAQVRKFHRHMFTNVSAALFQKIKSITGMEVRHTTVEIKATTGSVVQLFTTDTMGEKFLLAPGGNAGTQAPGHGPPPAHTKVSPSAKPTKPDVVGQEGPGRDGRLVGPRRHQREDDIAVACAKWSNSTA